MDRSSSLSARLKMLREKRDAESRGSTVRSTGDQAELRPDALPGWLKTGDYTWERSSVITIPAHIGPFSGEDSNLVYYDTETTGLSGGAGNLIFLFGHGRLKQSGVTPQAERSFEVKQIFLMDFPGEPEFLEKIRISIDEKACFVSYNGRAFDSHLLKTRYLMNGLSFDMPPQYDLLYDSRKLWRSLLEDCSLSTIEREVLGIGRSEDIPGYLVPDRYFQFLKNGNYEQLAPIFSHHLQDIYSLFLLDNKIKTILANPKEAGFVDVFQLGKMLLERDEERGLSYLKWVIAGGHGKAGSDVKILLSLVYKKRRDWRSAVAIWSDLFFHESDLFSGLELAKYFEHQENNPANALTISETLTEMTAKDRLRGELAHRIQRLKKKLERRVSKSKRF